MHQQNQKLSGKQLVIHTVRKWHIAATSPLQLFVNLPHKSECVFTGKKKHANFRSALATIKLPSFAPLHSLTPLLENNFKNHGRERQNLDGQEDRLYVSGDHIQTVMPGEESWCF